MSAVIAIVSSQLHAVSCTSWSDWKPVSNSLNEHVGYVIHGPWAAFTDSWFCVCLYDMDT